MPKGFLLRWGKNNMKLFTRPLRLPPIPEKPGHGLPASHSELGGNGRLAQQVASPESVFEASHGAVAPGALTPEAGHVTGTADLFDTSLLPSRSIADLTARLTQGAQITGEYKFDPNREAALKRHFVSTRATQIEQAVFVPGLPSAGKYNELAPELAKTLRAEARKVLEVSLEGAQRAPEIFRRLDNGETQTLVSALRELESPVFTSEQSPLFFDTEGKFHFPGDTAPHSQLTRLHPVEWKGLAPYSEPLTVDALQATEGLRGGRRIFLAPDRANAINYERLVASAHDIAALFSPNLDFEGTRAELYREHQAGSPPAQYAAALSKWSDDLRQSGFANDQPLTWSKDELDSRLAFLEPLASGRVREWYVPPRRQAPTRLRELGQQVQDSVRSADHQAASVFVGQMVAVVDRVV